jgi:AcrR family transcriptional regulator
MRKVPQQARSREMVGRLVAAARTVLVRDGYDAFSTNRVAEQAGASPGSLYQYFPHKAALVETVIDHWSEEISDRVAASLADRVDLVGPEMIRATADALLAALESDAPLLRIVWEELPAVQHRHRQRALERRVTELLTVYLAASGARRADGAATAWVLVMAMENIAVRWVLDRPEVSREQLLDEVVALAAGLGIGAG